MQAYQGGMIQATGLTKMFGEIEAVRDVSFSIADGDVVGLLGPNGAGKTTTMRMLTTFLPPTTGTAVVAGFDVLRQGHEVRKNIGYLPETPPLYPELTVKEYITFVAKIRGMPSRAVNDAVARALRRCALTAVADRLCGNLSKGYRQRVGLAQAIVHEPQVLILDEPTSGLDPKQIIEIRQLIRDLKGNHTVVLSTHILPEVAETCSRVIIIANGRITAEGSLAELTANATLEECFLQAIATDRVIEVPVAQSS